MPFLRPSNLRQVAARRATDDNMTGKGTTDMGYSEWGPYCLIFSIILLTGCRPPPVVVAENPPHYVIVIQRLGITESDFSVRVRADNAADERCQTFGRRAKLPAYETKCHTRHLFFRYCISYQYTYECVVDDVEATATPSQ